MRSVPARSTRQGMSITLRVSPFKGAMLGVEAMREQYGVRKKSFASVGQHGNR